MKNNPQFEFALSGSFTNPDFIYFDEDIEDEDTLLTARIVIVTLVDASKGSTTRLQALMCIFAGLTLRQAAEHCGKSYEWVRLQVEAVKESHPELYELLTKQTPYEVTSLIPLGKVKKWKATRGEKTIFFNNLWLFCKKNNYVYSTVIRNTNKSRLHDGWLFERNY